MFARCVGKLDAMEGTRRCLAEIGETEFGEGTTQALMSYWIGRQVTEEDWTNKGRPYIQAVLSTSVLASVIFAHIINDT